MCVVAVGAAKTLPANKTPSPTPIEILFNTFIEIPRLELPTCLPGANTSLNMPKTRRSRDMDVRSKVMRGTDRHVHDMHQKVPRTPTVYTVPSASA
jgi:hypothetical protein